MCWVSTHSTLGMGSLTHIPHPQHSVKDGLAQAFHIQVGAGLAGQLEATQGFVQLPALGT